MSQASNIPLPAPIRASGNLAVEWKRFKGQWNNYVVAAKLHREEKACQAAILLACIGADAYEIYTMLEFAAEADKADPEKLIEAFDRHCIGELNEVYERYIFNKRQQEQNENFDTFLGDLQRLVKTCQYGDVEDSIIRDRIVLGIRDDATRKKLLRTRQLNLVKAIDICRADEATSRQLKAMTSSEEVHAASEQRRSTSSHRSAKAYSYSGRRQRQRDNSSDRRCRYCDRSHGASKQDCPAYGKICSNCRKRNHFAAVCKSKPAVAVNDLTDHDEVLMTLSNTDGQRVYSNILVDGRRIHFLLDCGSTVNLLPAYIVASMDMHAHATAALDVENVR